MAYTYCFGQYNNIITSVFERFINGPEQYNHLCVDVPLTTTCSDLLKIVVQSDCRILTINMSTLYMYFFFTARNRKIKNKVFRNAVTVWCLSNTLTLIFWEKSLINAGIKCEKFNTTLRTDYDFRSSISTRNKSTISNRRRFVKSAKNIIIKLLIIVCRIIIIYHIIIIHIPSVRNTVVQLLYPLPIIITNIMTLCQFKSLFKSYRNDRDIDDYYTIKVITIITVHSQSTRLKFGRRRLGGLEFIVLFIHAMFILCIWFQPWESVTKLISMV